MNKKTLSHVFLICIFILLYLPIGYLIYYSFNAGGNMKEWTGFTMEHYANLFSDKRLLTFVGNTFIVALLSALIATVIGTLGAVAIYYTRRRKERDVVMNLNNILLVTPDVMMGASFLILFSAIFPLKLGFWTVLLSHIAFSIPIVVLMVLPRLYEMQDSMVMAAIDLGANHRQILSRVILPAISPGIISAFFMAFTYSLDDFAVTFFVTGNGFSTLSVEVYSRARTGITLEINALSTLMFILAFFLVFAYYRIQVAEIKEKQKLQRDEGGFAYEEA